MSNSNDGGTKGAHDLRTGEVPTVAGSALPSWTGEPVQQSASVAPAQQPASLAPAQQPASLAPAQQPASLAPAQQPKRRRWLPLVGLLAIGLIAGTAAGVGYLFGTRDGGETVASGSAVDGDADTTSEGNDQAAPAADEVTVADGTGGDDVGSGEAIAGDEIDESSPDYVAPEPDPNSGLGFESEEEDALGRPIPVLPDELFPNTEGATELPLYAEDPLDAPAAGPYMVIKNGLFFLRGDVASENIRQEQIRRVLLFLPPEALVVEYTIDPTSEWYLTDPAPVFLLDELLFDTNSTEVNPAFWPLLELGANLLILDPRSTITVTGHTDSRGSEADNLALAQARVDEVRRIYIEFGASPDQVLTESKGESEPLADNSTEEGRALNRRVEFSVEIGS